VSAWGGRWGRRWGARWGALAAQEPLVADPGLTLRNRIKRTRELSDDRVRSLTSGRDRQMTGGRVRSLASRSRPITTLG
jgi:hypothetical protein